jgi:hypothetical protein
MKELWSKQYLDHISFITYPFGLFLGSFESPRVSAGIPVTIPIPTGDQVADVLMKGLVWEKHDRFVGAMGVCRVG